MTGAASGIGRALALELAARGCDLALADRDEAGLAAVAAEINRDHSQKVTVHRVDVGEPPEIAEFARAAISAHPGLNILINNAGVALMGQFHETRSGCDGLADEHQFLGCGAWHARLPAASGEPA